MKKILPALATLLAGAVPAHAAPALHLSDGWMRAMPAGLPSGGYFTLHNDSGRIMILTGASSPACSMLMLHKSEGMSGMTSMEDVSQVPVAPGASLAFAPGGYHLMCMGATAALKPGGTVPVTLSFKDGASLTARFAVRNAAGK